MIAIYFLSVLLIFSLVFLIYSKNKEDNLKILVSKTSTSLLFVLIAVFAILNIGYTSYAIIMLVGFIFCFAGDILILDKKNTPRFILSIASFLTGHIFFISAFTALMGLSYLDVIFALALFLLAVITYIKIGFRLGKFLIPVVCYAIVISFMVVKAFSLVYLGYPSQIKTVLVVIGATFFFLSDILLVFLVFKKYSKKGSAINLILYYIGQMLLAYSILYTI